MWSETVLGRSLRQVQSHRGKPGFDSACCRADNRCMKQEMAVRASCLDDPTDQSGEAIPFRE